MPGYGILGVFSVEVGVVKRISQIEIIKTVEENLNLFISSEICFITDKNTPHTLKIVYWNF